MKWACNIGPEMTGLRNYFVFLLANFYTNNTFLPKNVHEGQGRQHPAFKVSGEMNKKCIWCNDGRAKYLENPT